jgi:hypothetical protein
LPQFFRSLATARSRADAEILWKEVDEGWIRFDAFSGMTLLLSPLARFALAAIDGNPQPLSPTQIVELVLAEERDADPAACFVEVESTLQILSGAELIEPCRL